jgi:peptidoglycan/LPS O-acetylase OafA/YrhL
VIPDPAPAPHRSFAYRPDIDGLRAVAVLLVVVFHFRLVPQAASGFLGVDVFFVISGYLITSIVTGQLAHGTFSLSQFYVGRIRRLAPPLVATLSSVMVAGALFLFPSALMELSRQGLATQLYVANVYYWRTVNYFGLSADSVYLLHTWSLAVEEQFYLVYPLLLLLLHRLGRRWLLPAIALLALSSFALNLHFVHGKPEATFYLLPTRAFELLGGAVVALWPALSPRSRVPAEVLGWMGAGLIAYGIVSHDRATVFPGTFALFPMLGTAALLASARHVRPATARVLGLPPFVYVGKLSYSLYLVHWPITVFATELLAERYDLPLRWLSLFASVVVAAAFTHGVEGPVRTGKVLASTRSLLTTYGVVLVATGLGFALVQGTEGLPARFAPEVAQTAALANDRPPPMLECEYDARHPERQLPCVLGDESVRPAWLVYGDSHAWALHPALDMWLRATGQAAYFMFRHACPPVFGVEQLNDNGQCRRFNELAERTAQRAEVTHVMLVSSWRQGVDGAFSETPGVFSSQAETARLLARKLAAGLDQLSRAGKQVYVWEPVPEAPGHVPLMMARALHHRRSPDLQSRLRDYRATYAYLFEVLDARRDRVRRIAPTSLLCRDDVCEATLAGKPVFFDNSHLSMGSQPHWARLLEQATTGTR